MIDHERLQYLVSAITTVVPQGETVYVVVGVDPLYEFWRAVKEDKLGEKAHVIIVGRLPPRAADDLSTYPFVQIGDVALLTYKRQGRITRIVPSMRGLFIKR